MRISDWSSDVCSSDLAAAQLDPGRPAEGPYPADVEQLARRSVRLGAVEADRAVEPDDLADHLRQLHDRQVVAGTDIDHALAGIVGHQPDAGIGQVVDVQELPHRPAAAPDDDVAEIGRDNV